MQIFDINRRQPSKTGPKELWTTWPLATRAWATAGDWRKALHASTSSSWVHDSVITQYPLQKTTKLVQKPWTSLHVRKSLGNTQTIWSDFKWPSDKGLMMSLSDAFRSGCNRGLPESLIQGAGKFEPYAAKKQVDFSAEFHS